MSDSGSTSGATRNAVFIANPGARHLAERREALERAVRRETAAAGIDAHIVWTERPGHASEIADDTAHESVDLIFACGGDGTLNEILNGLRDFDAASAPAVGLVPAGTADVWAREAGIPRRDFAAAIRDITAHDRAEAQRILEDGLERLGPIPTLTKLAFTLGLNL